MADETSQPLAVETSIRARRKRRGWTQEQLAALAGLSTTAIHNLEAGKNGFTDKTLMAIADAFGCHPADLLMDPDVGNEPIRGMAAIEAVIRRIEGMTEKDVQIALGVIGNALQVNAASQEQSPPQDQRKRAIRQPQGAAPASPQATRRRA